MHELPLLPGQRFHTQVSFPFFFAVHDEGVTYQFVNTADVNAWSPVVGKRDKSRTVDRTNTGEHVYTVLILNCFECVTARQTATHANFHDFVCVQSGTASATECLLANGLFRHFVEVLNNVLDNITRLVHEAHGACRVTGIVECCDDMIISAGIKFQLIVLHEVSCELCDVNHLGLTCVLKHGTGDRALGNFKEVRRTVHGIHVLVDNTPHMTALTAENPFCSEAFSFGIHLGIKFLHHVRRCEQTEVTAFRCIGGQGVVETDVIEQHQVTHEGIDAGISKNVTGRSDEDYFMTLFVDGNVDAFTCDFFDIVNHEVNDVFESVRLDTKVVTCTVTVRNRLKDPVDVHTAKVQQFTCHHGYFRCIDAVRAEQGTPATLSALVEVDKPFFGDIFGHDSGTGEGAQNLSGHGKVLAVNGTHKLRTQDRHVLRITGTDEKVTLVSTSTTANTDIHEYFK